MIISTGGVCNFKYCNPSKQLLPHGES